jgi:hypothetical protein
MFRRAWDMFHTLLQRRCSKTIQRKIFICCRSPSGSSLLAKCHVPHATTDLMLSRVRGAVMDEAASSRMVHCFGGREELTTPRLSTPNSSLTLSRVLGIERKELLLCYGKWRLLSRELGCEQCSKSSQVCCRRDGDDLVCHRREATQREARAAGFYATTRLAYHLFDSFQRSAFLSRERIEWSNLTVAPLYRRALGLPEFVQVT